MADGPELVRTGPDDLVKLLQLVRREVARLTDLDDLPLVGLNAAHGIGHLAGQIGRDVDRAMLVAVQQVTRFDPQPTDLDRQSEIHHVDIGVRDRDVRGGKLKTEGAHFVEIAHRGQVIRSYWTDPQVTQAAIEQPVTEEMRGGFTLRVTMVRENRAYLTTQVIDVQLTYTWRVGLMEDSEVPMPGYAAQYTLSYTNKPEDLKPEKMQLSDMTFEELKAQLAVLEQRVRYSGPDPMKLTPAQAKE